MDPTNGRVNAEHTTQLSNPVCAVDEQMAHSRKRTWTRSVSCGYRVGNMKPGLRWKPQKHECPVPKHGCYPGAKRPAHNDCTHHYTQGTPPTAERLPASWSEVYPSCPSSAHWDPGPWVWKATGHPAPPQAAELGWGAGWKSLWSHQRRK